MNSSDSDEPGMGYEDVLEPAGVEVSPLVGPSAGDEESSGDDGCGDSGWLDSVSEGDSLEDSVGVLEDGSVGNSEEDSLGGCGPGPPGPSGVVPGRSDRCDVPGCPGVPAGAGAGAGGGGRTVVVGVPSGPIVTTVVGAADDDIAPASATPVMVIVPVPGTALPGINWEPPEGAVPCAGGGPLLASVKPPPASSATAPKAVATTRPLTASMA